MSRYIDADTFDADLLRSGFANMLGVGTKRKFTIGEIRTMIQNRPTADVVPVVRCGECKHKHIKSTVWVCNFGMLMQGAEGYCSYGEKVSE